jgi:hypothetical protein
MRDKKVERRTKLRRNTVDKEKNTMDNEIKTSEKVTATTSEEATGTAPIEVIATKPRLSVPASKSGIVQMVNSLQNDVAHLRPSRNKQRSVVYWLGQDVRKLKDCPFHFVWRHKSKSTDDLVNQSNDGYRVASKKAFTYDNKAGKKQLALTVASDSTPNLDIYTCDNLVLCFITQESHIKERGKLSVKSKMKTRDMYNRNKEAMAQSAQRLSIGDTQGATDSIAASNHTTDQIQKRLDTASADDVSKILSGVDDGFPKTTYKI